MSMMMEKERLQTKLNEYQKHGNEYKNKYRDLKNSMTEKYRYFKQTLEQKEKELKLAQNSFKEMNESYGRISRDFDSNLLKLNEL